MASKKIKVDLDLENNKIENLADPTVAQDAATKNYVDNNAGGSGHFLKLDDTAPTSINDDVYTGGDLYFSGKNARASYFNQGTGVGSIAITDNDNISTTDQEGVFVGGDIGFTTTLLDQGRVSLGFRAGKNSSARFCMFLGGRSGENFDDNSLNTIVIGISAARGGSSGGSQAVIIGNSAGRGTAGNSVIVGHNAGNNANGIKSNTVAIGQSAANGTASYVGSTVIGTSSGLNAIGLSNSTMIGLESGRESNISSCVGVGSLTLRDSTGSNNCAFGNDAGRNSNASDSVYIGTGAGNGNALNGSFVVKNENLPNFADRAAALLAITILNGAVTGNTYLYFNDSNGAIEGVRL